MASAPLEGNIKLFPTLYPVNKFVIFLALFLHDILQYKVGRVTSVSSVSKTCPFVELEIIQGHIIQPHNQIVSVP